MKKNKKTGFTLLLSLLVMSVVLVVGLGVFNIIVKEIELSGLNRESAIASYAAETGIECVEYWDWQKKAISTTTPISITCAGNAISAAWSSGIAIFDLALANGSCAKVTINKQTSSTVITSEGFNLGCAVSSPFKVERVWKVSYFTI
jgi:Tfp pilus assembly protein PilX